MPDLSQDSLSSTEPTPRVLTVRRRLEGVVLGAISGGATGWLSVLIGGVHGAMRWEVVAGLAALAAALGYRYGRSVVLATVAAFVEVGPGE